MEIINPALPEVNVKPLGDIMLDFLIAHDNEEPFIDFKETINTSKESPFAKIAKDIFAFSNYGGGFLLIGFKERPKLPKEEQEKKEEKAKKIHFLPIGLPDDFHIEQASLQEKFNAYSNFPIALDYLEFFRTIEGVNKKFAAIYVPPSTSVLKPMKKGLYSDLKGKEHVAFEAGTILFRRGTQSIVASAEEALWIQRRAEKEGYRLSILSGQPDQVLETVYSNLFEVIKIPKIIWTASLRNRNYLVKNNFEVNKSGLVYIIWENKLITFNDISTPSSPLWNMVEPLSVHMEGLSSWLSDSDKQRTIIFLLNKELSFLARRLKLEQEVKITKFSKRKQKPIFYYPCSAESRIETWTPRYRKSSKVRVAQKMWSQQLGRNIWWHVCIRAQFTCIEGQLFLRLLPSLLITENGKDVVSEGALVTHLIYNRYNSSYFNSFLFWISRFAEENDVVSLAEGKIEVSTDPSDAKVNFGILFDRPAAELVQEVPDVETIEEE
jgi:hypothetical protein